MMYDMNGNQDCDMRFYLLSLPWIMYRGGNKKDEMKRDELLRYFTGS